MSAERTAIDDMLGASEPEAFTLSPEQFEHWMQTGAGRLRATLDVLEELDRAREKFPPFASAHEGFAILKEEVDELWDEVKGNALGRRQRMREEAIQVAAMAIRFIEDVCDKKEDGA
jgi:hypothetical protein